MNPGSKEAVEAGCLCPIIDNNKGIGAYMRADGQPVWWYNGDCPIHGEAKDVEDDTVLVPIR